MSVPFHAPEGALWSNVGLLAGTVIQELRMHPYIDQELKRGCWNYQPEYLEFTVLSIEQGQYLCQYSGKTDTFWWPTWEKQPRYGFMEDGCTPVRYYVKEAPLPPPSPERESSLSPYSLRCAEIDEVALLLRDPEAFASAAAEPALSPRDGGVYLERPSKKFIERGGCPFYQGCLNGGSGANVLCAGTPRQLHGYVKVKLCEEGRKAYCPIWRAKNGH